MSDAARGTNRARALSSAFPIFHAAAGRESLPITHCPLQLKLPDRTREYRLPADRFDISSAVDANLFVAPAICSQQSMSAEEISNWSGIARSNDISFWENHSNYQRTRKYNTIKWDSYIFHVTYLYFYRVQIQFLSRGIVKERNRKWDAMGNYVWSRCHSLLQDWFN